MFRLVFPSPKAELNGLRAENLLELLKKKSFSI